MPRSFLLILCCLTAPAWARAATNLVTNSQFTADVTAWAPLAFEPAVMDWSPLDEVGKAGSGSLRMTAIAANSTVGVKSNCFDLTPGAPVVFGATALSSTPTEGHPRLWLYMYKSPGCGGAYSHIMLDNLSTNAGSSTWGPMQGALAATHPDILSGRLVMKFDADEDPPAEVLFDNVFVYEGETCVAANMVACLGDRFRLGVRWRLGDGTRGHGRLRSFSEDSAYATFFDAANLEAVVKVLDGCAVNERFWIFAAGLTNVEVWLVVTDTSKNLSWVHHSELDEPFAPVQDTAALATCPK